MDAAARLSRTRTALLRRAGMSGSIIVIAASLLLAGCGSDDPEPSAEESPSTPTTSVGSEGPSVDSTTPPEPVKPKEPTFRADKAGKRAFVAYAVDSWRYGLQTNDASLLLDASGKKPCRGCDSLRKELKQRKKEGWHVQLPEVKIRKMTFRPDGPVEVATAVVDIPASRSFFDDGTFRNDNKAHKGARFVIDVRADGAKKKRHWTLLAFSIK